MSDDIHVTGEPVDLVKLANIGIVTALSLLESEFADREEYAATMLRVLLDRLSQS